MTVLRASKAGCESEFRKYVCSLQVHCRQGREVGEACSIVNKEDRKKESCAAMLIGRQEGGELQDKAGKGDEGREQQR